MRIFELYSRMLLLRRPLIGALVVSGLLAAACGSDVTSTAESETRLVDAEAALVEAEAAAAEARSEAEAAQAEAEAAHGAVDVMRAEAEAAQVVADEARAAADAVRAEAAAAQGEVEEAEAAAAAARAEAEAAQVVADEARAAADAVRAEAEAAQGEVEEAEAAADAARAQAVVARLEVEEAEAAAAAARAEAAAAQAAQEQAAASSTVTAETPTSTATTAAPPPAEEGPSPDMATDEAMDGDMDMGDGTGMAAAGDGFGSAATPARAPQLSLGPCRGCSSNTFEDYGVNPFVNTAEDPASTFALDVDTASYVVARNYLRGGALPPPAAVRTEEFVNYFDGGYEPVPDEFVIDTEAAPSPFAPDGYVLLRVGVQAPVVLADVVFPQSVIVVMDRSGSMGETAGYGGEQLERIRLAHQAVGLLLDGLSDGVRVGIVSYDDVVDTVVEPTDVAGNRDRIMQLVRDEVYPRGSTNAEAGLVSGYDMALREADAGRTVLVILLSDGVANVGATRTEEILEGIGERGDIGLSTVGVGLGPFNDVLMEQLANTADGTYHYIDSFEEARRIFAENLESLLSLAARDAKIQVVFNPDTVRSYRLLGFENRDVADEDFRDNTVDAGEVGLGQSATALYELELEEPGGESGDPSWLATATLRYERVRRGSITEIEESITEADIIASFAAAAAHFRLAAVVAEFAEVLRGSPFVDDGDAGMSVLATEAAAVAEALSGNPEAAELTRLIDAARRARGDTDGGG